MVRIPGLARNEALPGNLYTFAYNGDKTATIAINHENVTVNLQKGYAVLKRTWKPGDVISVDLPMEARKILWNNKGHSEMQVWLSIRKPRVLPDSLIILDVSAGDSASTNYVSPWENLNSIYDLYDPLNSGDKGTGAFGNWRHNNGPIGVWNWVQYDFHKEYKISSSDVYWWDDNQGITLPDSAYISYWDANTKSFIKIPGTVCGKRSGTIRWDQYNTTHFEPVTTNRIRLSFLGYQKPQGILEWSLYRPGEQHTSINNKIIDQVNAFKMYPNTAQNKINIELNNFNNKC